MSVQPPVLEARDLTVTFGGVLALDAVDLAVPRAEIVGLMGPNGAGKTTLFNVVSGLLRPGAGAVEVSGRVVTNASPQRRAQLGMARTFQRPELFGELTVREQFVLARRMRHPTHRYWAEILGFGARPTHEEHERIDLLLERLGLEPVADHEAGSLPLGTGRLVEVGRALATDPSIVLLDEPSSGLDDRETEVLGAALRRTRDEQDVAFLLVEHDVEFVLGLSDTVYVLDFGEMIAFGPPEQIRHDPIIQAAYLGRSVEAT
jgi:ABC-type branched-subunit amino acid transport system ATPase component